MDDYQKLQAYKRYQVEQCKKHADYDMVIEHLYPIMRRSDIDKTNCEMFEVIKDAIIDIMAQYGWLDPLYETVMENNRLETLENDDAYVNACELQMNYEKETAVIGDTA